MATRPSLPQLEPAPAEAGPGPCWDPALTAAHQASGLVLVKAKFIFIALQGGSDDGEFSSTPVESAFGLFSRNRTSNLVQYRINQRQEKHQSD